LLFDEKNKHGTRRIENTANDNTTLDGLEINEKYKYLGFFYACGPVSNVQACKRGSVAS
jgi:hypothetical protein